MKWMSPSATVLPSTSEIWDQAQLPFCTKAHLPRAKSAMESVTVLAAAAEGATVELLR